jgi:microcystin-dependent protein
MIVQYAGISSPTGWLICDGTAVSRSTYSALFSSLSNSFNTATVTNTSTTVSGLSGMVAGTHVGWGIAGTGIPTGATISSVTNTTTVVISAAATSTATGTANVSISPYGFTGAGNTTTFNLPNFKGRTPVGLDSSQTEFNYLGEIGGSKTSTAPHDHSIAHDHAAFNATSGNVSQNHSHGFDLNIVHSDGTPVFGEILNVGIFLGNGVSRYIDGTGGHSADHTHTTSIDVPAFTGTSGQSSASASSGNLQPYLTVNYIIKT